MRSLIFFLPVLLMIYFNSNRSGNNNLIPEHVATSFQLHDTVHLYFPLKDKGQDSLSNTNALDTFKNIWYSKMLFALDEPILANYNESEEILRFTWLRTFNHPVSVRIQKQNNRINLTVKVSSGAGGYEPGKIIINKNILLNMDDWNKLKSKFDELNFFNLPVEKADYYGVDGAEWILEYASKDRYHFTTRWSPSKKSNYGKCCLYFVHLAGLKIPNAEEY
jgi:hypothetical protein